LDVESTDLAGAVELAATADVTILALGGRPGWFGKNITEGEASDTANIELPAGQVALVKAVAAASKQTVGIIFSGRPFALTEVVDDLSSVLYAYYGGQRAGQAAAAALFGDVNPGGKLPYSLPRHSGQVPIYVGQHNGSGYRKSASNLNLNYLDMPATPLFPFGHGLSYTSFEYSRLIPSDPIVDIHDEVSFSVMVRNVGALDGDEVVQLYFSDRASGITRPAQELVGFRRLHLKAGQTQKVEFTVEMKQLGYLDSDGLFALEPGNIDVSVGSSSRDLRLTAQFTVIGNRREMTTFERGFLSTSSVVS
jgi:beta-xylosidase